MLALGGAPNPDDASGVIGGSASAAVFALVGLILLFAALRLVRARREPNGRRYTLPRH
ncbi:MAG TPA: hypothetical protein VH309_11865 [Elusimicrobiota bacterium]|jgi:hypothetical protein|nr:hypothetical protein [Elusimicrobiota bacterium]